MSFSKKVKASVKRAITWIGNFETCAAELGIEKGYDYVICGHIHQPQDRTIQSENGNIRYLNSGDWIENLTALEYENGDWHIYQYAEAKTAHATVFEFTKKHPFPDVVNNPLELVIQSLTK